MSSEKSTSTVTGRARGVGNVSETGQLSRSGSLGSLTPTLGRGDKAYKRVEEVAEDDARDDLISWSLRGGVTT